MPQEILLNSDLSCHRPIFQFLISALIPLSCIMNFCRSSAFQAVESNFLYLSGLLIDQYTGNLCLLRIGDPVHLSRDTVLSMEKKGQCSCRLYRTLLQRQIAPVQNLWTSIRPAAMHFLLHTCFFGASQYWVQPIYAKARGQP